MNEIDKFVNGLTAATTKATYRSNLRLYFKIIKADPNNYFNDKRDYQADVKAFWHSQIDSPACSRNGRMNVVRQFLEENDIEFKKKIWKNFRKGKQRGNRPITMDRSPTNYELKKILAHGDLKSRALFLIASSSGARISEILQIKPEDIDFKSDPTKIYIRASYTKTNTPRITFISNESKETLEAWLKERDEYLRNAVAKSKGRYEKSIDDPTVFPIKYGMAKKMWNNMIRKAGLNERDPESKRYILHIHTLRKFFRTNMTPIITLDITEALMGHEGYLTDAYRRYNEKQLGEMYLKGVKNLLVFETTSDERINDLDIQLKDVTMDNAKLKQEIFELRQMISELGNQKLEQAKELSKK